ncbi:MAG: hypothetical protein MHPSP_004243, partial [Paramarteilia canceri]
ESKLDEDQIKKKITDMSNKLEEKIENLNKTIALSEIELNKSIKDIRKKNENDQKTREKNYRIQSNGSQKVLMKSSQNSSKSDEANE